MRAATARFARPRLLALMQGMVSAFILAALCAAPALAETVTIGQIAPVGSTSTCIGCTNFQRSNAGTSPSYVVPAGTWTITSWSAQAGTSDSQARLRVFRPGPASDEYTLLAESPDESIPANTSGPFATSILVQGGDLIGIRTGDNPGNISTAYSSGIGGDIYFAVLGDPAVGNSVCGAGSMFSCASLGGWLTNIAATLLAPSPPGAAPSNAFTFGSLKRNTHRGTATVAVNVPGPGTLSLTGKGVKIQRTSGAVTSKSVTAAGVVKLLIKARGAAKRKLNRTGKAKVKVKVTFTPAAGSPSSQSKRVKLIKKR